MLRNLSFEIAWKRVLIGALLIVLGAQIYVPLKPVPITMQNLAAMFVCLMYPPKEAVFATILYVLFGCLNLPVFSGFAIDPFRVFGPTGGYLLGFIAAAYIVSQLKGVFGFDSWIKLFLLSSIASIVIYTVGIFRLAFFIGFEAAIAGGLLPFIIPGVVKCILLSTSLKMVNNHKL